MLNGKPLFTWSRWGFAAAPAVSATFSLRDSPARCLLSQVVPGGSGWVLRTILNPKSSWVLAQLHREFGVTIPGVDRSCGDGALGDVVGGHCGDGDLKSFPTLMVLCETCWSGDVMFPKVPCCDCRDGQQCA